MLDRVARQGRSVCRLGFRRSTNPDSSIRFGRRCGRATVASGPSNGIRHPAEMGEPEINAFLTHLAVQKKVKTTMIYTHVLNRGPAGAGSAVDGLWNHFGRLCYADPHKMP